MSKATITIEGRSEIDTIERKKAIEQIARLDTKALKNLASLEGSEKARKYLSDPVKFQTLKTFL